MLTQFQLLGGVSVVQDATVLPRLSPKVRQLLALLITHAGESVSTGAIVDEMWGDEPPASAVATVQSYICQLRRVMARYRCTAVGPQLLSSTTNGYRLEIEPEQVDAFHFQRLARLGLTALDRGDLEAASLRLRSALRLWRGPALDDVVRGVDLESYAYGLENERMRVYEACIRAELDCGMHAELIIELRRLIARHPLHEQFHHLLIEALERSGHRLEALSAYDALRKVLRVELGLDPSAAARDLHRRLLVS